MTIWVPPGANGKTGSKGIYIAHIAGSLLGDRQPLAYKLDIAAIGRQQPVNLQVRYWRCGNCGHLEQQTPSLRELLYTQVNELTSKTSCPNCGSYTINQLYDLSFKRGCFLVVKARNGIRGKGK